MMRERPSTIAIRFFFGIAAGAYAAAVLYGWTSGGVDWGLFPGHLGDLWFQALGAVTLGYKGSVGDHVGYGILLAFGLCSFTVGVLMVVTDDGEGPTLERPPLDAGPAELGDGPPPIGPVPTRLPASSPWPLLGAVAVTLLALGWVLERFLLLAGFGLLTVVAIGWLQAAHADRVAGMAAAGFSPDEVAPDPLLAAVRASAWATRAVRACSVAFIAFGTFVLFAAFMTRRGEALAGVVALGFGVLLRSAVESALAPAGSAGAAGDASG